MDTSALPGQQSGPGYAPRAFAKCMRQAGRLGRFFSHNRAASGRVTYKPSLNLAIEWCTTLGGTHADSLTSCQPHSIARWLWFNTYSRKLIGAALVICYKTGMLCIITFFYYLSIINTAGII